MKLRPLTIFVCSLFILALALLTYRSTIARTDAWGTIRVSVNPLGVEGDLESRDQDLSADGRYVAFQSNAFNLVEGHAFAIFVLDRQTNDLTVASVNTAGQGANNVAEHPAITPDGRFVAFDSPATDLVETDANGQWDVFVHDRQTGETSLVSVSSDGQQANNRSQNGVMSADGRFVAFISEASNLVADDTNHGWDAFVHDRQTGETTLVSVSSSGVQANSEVYEPAISADGRFISFSTRADNLVDGDDNSVPDVFVHDRQTGQTDRVSVDSNGVSGNGMSAYSDLSADGRYVAFDSTADNLVPGDTNGKSDIFVHDRQTGKTSLVSVGRRGVRGNGDSTEPSISADGSIVAFRSFASNFTAGDNNYVADIFTHNRATGETLCASVSSSGELQNNYAYELALSGDGRVVAFSSDATNLVPNDTNGAMDIFVRERVASESFFVHIPVVVSP